MGKIIGLIPARGGSKRVKNKNIRMVGNVPLIAYTINTLFDCKYIDDVYVSTDSKEIKDISLDYGANVIDRPNDISDDYSQLEPTIIHTLNELKDDIDIIGTFQCTSPFKYSNDIDNGILKMKLNNYDSLVFMCELNRFIWDRNMKPINYDYKDRIRSQDKIWELIEIGDYLSKPNKLIESNNRICGNIGYYISNRLSYFDIDTEDDLELVNIISKGYKFYEKNK